MAKTNPIGVRFDERILEKYPDLTPQKILNKLTDADLFVDGVIRLKIKTVKEVPTNELEKFEVTRGPIKVQTDIPKGEMDLLRGFEAPKKYDFGDAKFLIIENFTKYPMKEKPVNKFEAAAWLKKKATADAEIKEAWNNRNI